ncbi:MAG: MOSC domain-containing protein [Candidatus Eremiobacteraeota bacterium]|nr:MOSC domain-containing protein [Candidatus Eremiobacteraeota bacterium]
MKSFRGERVNSLRFNGGGPEHDREFMLVDDSELRRGKRLTARELHGLLGFSATYEDGAVAVVAPDGTRVRSDDADFATRIRDMVGHPLTLHEDTSGANHDDSDVLVINMESARALAQEYGETRSYRRFRPNIVLDGAGATPYVELTWIGKRFTVGGVEIEASAPNLRCAIPTVDPDTLEVDPKFLRFIVEKHDGIFGVYCRVIKGGTIHEGDQWNAVG